MTAYFNDSKWGGFLSLIGMCKAGLCKCNLHVYPWLLRFGDLVAQDYLLTMKPLPSSFDLTSFTKDAASQSAHLLQLPDELVVNVFRRIQHPHDQVALMLSCKHLANVASNVELNTMIVQGVNYMKLRFDHRHLLKALKRWNWIPDNLLLCRECEMYLPRERIWKDRQGKEISRLMLVDWMGAFAFWKKGGGICPPCQIPDDFVEGEEWLQAWPEGLAPGPLRRQRLG